MSLKNKFLKKIDKYVLLKNGIIYDPFIGIYKKQDILIKDGVISSIKNRIATKTNYNVLICE